MGQSWCRTSWYTKPHSLLPNNEDDTHTPSPSPYSLCVNTHNHRLLGQTSQNFTSYKQEENETLKEFSHSVQILSITSGHVIALKVCYMNSTADSELSNNLVVI